MRTIYDPQYGNDVTSSVQSILASGRTFFTRFLFRFQVLGFWFNNPQNNFVDFTYTTDFPIIVYKYQTTAVGANPLGPYSGGVLVNSGDVFLPERIEVSGSFQYEVGFADHPVEVTWYIDDEVNYMGNSRQPFNQVLTPPNLTLKQAMISGAFNEAPFWIHQAIFTSDPRTGGTFIGTVLMWRGYIRKVTPTRNALVLSISSLMDVFQQVQIPTQTLLPNCRAVPFLPAPGGTYSGNKTTWTGIDSVVSPTAVTFLWGPGTHILTDALKDYYMAFTSNSAGGILPWGTGMPPAPFWRIRGNDDNNSNTGLVTVRFYEPPIIPVSVSDIIVYGQTSQTGTPPGFPYIPPPEFAV